MATLYYGNHIFDVQGTVRASDFLEPGTVNVTLKDGRLMTLATGRGIHAAVVNSDPEKKPRGRAVSF